MKKLLLSAAILALAGYADSAHAVDTATVVASCGTPPATYVAGQPFPVTQDTSGTICTNSSGSVTASLAGKATAAAPSYSEGTSNPLSMDLSGNLRTLDAAANATLTSILSAVQSPIPAGTNVIGHVIVDSGASAVTNAGTFIVQAQPTPVTSGGLTWFFLQPIAGDNHAAIKNGAGQVYHISSTNNSATINYLRLYNAGTGFNGCNSATNRVYEQAIPASTSGAGFVEDIPMGIAFATGISICVTSAYATNDTTNATATAINLSIGYK